MMTWRACVPLLVLMALLPLTNSAPNAIFGGLSDSDFDVLPHSLLKSAPSLNRESHFVVRSSGMTMSEVPTDLRIFVSGVVGSTHVLLFQQKSHPNATGLRTSPLLHSRASLNATSAAMVLDKHKYAPWAIRATVNTYLSFGPGWSIPVEAHVAPALLALADKGKARVAAMAAEALRRARARCGGLAATWRWIHHRAEAVGTAHAFVTALPTAKVILRFSKASGSVIDDECVTLAVLDAAAALAACPETFSVQGVPPVTTQNMHASALLQTGSAILTSKQGEGIDARAYHAAGFTGKGALLAAAAPRLPESQGRTQARWSASPTPASITTCASSGTTIARSLSTGSIPHTAR